MSTSDKEMVRIRNAAWTLHTVPMWWRTSCFTSLEKRNSERLYWTNERSVIYSIQQIRLPTSKSSTTDQSWDNLKVEYSICSQSHYPSTLWNRITSRDLRAWFFFEMELSLHPANGATIGKRVPFQKKWSVHLVEWTFHWVGNGGSIWKTPSKNHTHCHFSKSCLPLPFY